VEDVRPAALNYPPNPDYGHGSCVRRIIIRSETGLARGHLTDNFHEMRCLVAHKAGLITQISCDTVRIPTTACPAAAGQIQEFIGLPIGTATRDFYSGGRARYHCTHLLDLVVMTISRAAAPAPIVYEATVPDELDEPVALTILRNDQLVHRWLIREGIIIEPAQLRGRTLDRGFAAWASVIFDADAFEAATILARTWLVAIGRRYIPALAAGQPALNNPEMRDRCYAYSMPQVADAVFTGEPEVRLGTSTADAEAL